jgi:hypothetical protein
LISGSLSSWNLSINRRSEFTTAFVSACRYEAEFWQHCYPKVGRFHTLAPGNRTFLHSGAKARPALSADPDLPDHFARYYGWPVPGSCTAAIANLENVC